MADDCYRSCVKYILPIIISTRGGVTRQLFGLYFPILFMDLAGKSGKWGLDKILVAPPAAR